MPGVEWIDPGFHDQFLVDRNDLGDNPVRLNDSTHGLGRKPLNYTAHRSLDFQSPDPVSKRESRFTYADLLGRHTAGLIEGGTGGDVISGGLGTDTATYANSTAGVSIDLTAGTASGGDAAGDVLSGIENLIGSGFDDVFTGGAGNDTLQGLGGNDTVSGGGADGWTDVIVLQNEDGSSVGSGGTVNVT